MFAAYKQVRYSTAFLYQIAGSLLMLALTINVWYISKVSVPTVSKKSGVIKWNMLNFMEIVYNLVLEYHSVQNFPSKDFCQSLV